jgi:hypothetical protein
MPCPYKEFFRLKDLFEDNSKKFLFTQFHSVDTWMVPIDSN